MVGELLSRLDSKSLMNFMKEKINPSEVSSLIELDDTRSLKKSRKRAYKIKLINDNTHIHLSYGHNLDKVFSKQKIAYQLIPELICEPYFLIDLGNSLYLYAQEFWNGKPLDDLKDENKISKILCQIDLRLSSLVVSSTTEEMQNEWMSLKTEIFSVIELSSFDKSIIENIINTLFESKVALTQPKKRWSCGDFTSRNILVSKDYKYKIIDLEFSRETHFYYEDWIRLKIYSDKKLSEIPILIEKIKNLPTYIEAYFWMRQYLLDGTVKGEMKYQYLKLNLANAIQAANFKERDFKKNSIFINGLLGVCNDHLSIINNQNKEIISLSKKSEVYCDQLTIIENLEKEIISLKVKLVENNKKISSFEYELEVLLDKIYRMKNSFSWKITSLLRLLRRKFIDTYSSSINKNKSSFLTSNIQNTNDNSYTSWLSIYDTIDENRLVDLRYRFEVIDYLPKISIILPVFCPDPVLLEKAIRSVKAQVYTNWELCIVDDGSDQKELTEILTKSAKIDDRIKYKYSEENEHISLASNKAVELSTGEYICFLDHDDELRPHSLLVLAETINKNRDVKFIYSDEDKIDIYGNRSGPYFKPDWNPELLLSQNYLCHLVCIEKCKILEVGGFRKGFEGSQDWDLFLRITETLSEQHIVHVPQILYHWRKSDNSTAKSLECKLYILDSAKNTLHSLLRRRKISGEVISSNSKFNYWRIKRNLPQEIPLVSILIPSKNKVEYLEKCIDSIKSKTSYTNYELIILNNESDEDNCIRYLQNLESRKIAKVINVPGEFNYSKINNIGVKHASGDIIALLNNDIEVISQDWLDEMVSHVVRKDIGCVGAKLLYSDQTIQHAGVIVGLGGVAGHPYKRFPKDHSGQFYRLHLLQNYEAVTAACLLVRKSIYEEVNGLDEKKFKVAFNDVDFCLKVRRKGYRNLWTPYAVMFHHESVSRGSDQTEKNRKRFMSEVMEMKKKWKSTLEHDPNYNPNLTYCKEDFSLAFPPKPHPNGIF